MSISIKLDQVALSGALRDLRATPERMTKAIVGAVNDTARHCESVISKGIRKRIKIKRSDLDKYIRHRWATKENQVATVTVLHDKRIPLKYFGARQAKAGVSYQIDPTGGRKVALSAFGPKIPRLGGNVFKRVGKARLPIRMLLGPSAWGVFVKNGMVQPTAEDCQAFLSNRLQHRLQYAVPRKKAS